MELTLTHFIILGVVSGLTKGAGVLTDGPLNAAVGETVMFTTTLTPTETPFVSVDWSFGDKFIITSNTVNVTEPEYEGRITLFISTGSLELRNVALTDSGKYSVNIIPSGGRRMEGSTELNVLGPVSDVKATANTTDLVEFISSVRLSCSSSGSPPFSFLWLNGSSEVTESHRVQLTDGGSTLTILNVARYDQEQFKCRVSNPVSNDTSDPVKLSFSFGPENTKLTISPSKQYYEEGSNIILNCSTVSSPAAQFYWFLNGVKLSETESELRLINIHRNQSGNYSCQAFNSKTGRNERSQPLFVSVLEPVSDVKATANTTDLVEFISSVRLPCSSSGSPPFSFLWLNGSSEVTESHRVQLTDGGSTLTILNVARYDQEQFKCRVSNPVSNDTSDPVKLSFSFGPENTKLTISPSKQYYEEGSNIILNCSTVSSPAAQFYWFLNGVKLSETESELRLINIHRNQSGNYSCQAFNNKTGRNERSQPLFVSVLDKPTTSGCSGGCIAGVVIGSLVVIGAAVGGAYYIYIKKFRSKNMTQSTSRNTNDTSTPTEPEKNENEESPETNESM